MNQCLGLYVDGYLLLPELHRSCPKAKLFNAEVLLLAILNCKSPLSFKLVLC